MTKKFTQLTAASSLADDDQLAIIQNYSTTPVSRRTAISLIKSTLKTYFDTLYTSITGSAILPISVIDGLVLSNNVTDANNDIDIAAGKVVDGGGTENLVLSSGITKRLDAAWTVGTNQGGLDTGAKANSTFYHVWLIKRTDTGVVDVLFSTSGTAPTMPTSYTKKHRIGAVRTDGSGNILAFLQYGDTFLYKSPILSVDVSTLGTSKTNYAIAVPNGLIVEAILNVGNVASGAIQIYISNPNFTDLAPSVSVAPLGTVASSGTLLTNQVKIFTDTSSQISARSSAASTTFRVAVLGWVDPRGKW